MCYKKSNKALALASRWPVSPSHAAVLPEAVDVNCITTAAPAPQPSCQTFHAAAGAILRPEGSSPGAPMRRWMAVWNATAWSGRPSSSRSLPLLRSRGQAGRAQLRSLAVSFTTRSSLSQLSRIAICRMLTQLFSSSTAVVIVGVQCITGNERMACDVALEQRDASVMKHK